MLEQQGYRGHAGTKMSVIPEKVPHKKWDPDLLAVDYDHATKMCCLTIIELEDKDEEALVSARKYLPENSAQIRKDFENYLCQVISECHRTANRNVEVFETLQTCLPESVFIVRAAGARRSGGNFLEVLQLIDQGKLNQETTKKLDVPLRSNQTIVNVEKRLTKEQNQKLNRVLHVLDAVVCGKGDLGTGILTKWLGRSPLKRAVAKEKAQYHALSAYLDSAKSGQGDWNPTQIAEELARLWKSSRHGESFFPRSDPAEIQSTIEELLPIAEQWKRTARVRECATDIDNFLKRRREAPSACSG